MKNYIKKHWKLTIFLIAAVVFTVFVMTRKAKIEPVLTPTPMTVPFELLNTFPPPGERQIPLPNMAIEFTFSKELNISSAVVEVKPFVGFEFAIGRNKNTLVIYPTNEWQYAVSYEVSVDIQSSDGQRLLSPIKYSFTPLKFTDSDMIK